MAQVLTGKQMATVMHDFIDQIQSFSEVHLALLSCLQFILVVILNTIYLSYSRNSVDGLL